MNHALRASVPQFVTREVGWGVLTCVWICAASALSILYQGWDFGINNNATHIAIIEKYRDATLFADNPFIEALKNYCTVIWWLLARATFVRDLPTAFFALHFFARCLTLYAVFRIIYVVSNDKISALVGATILSFSGALQTFTPISRSDLLITYANHTSIAIACVLISYSAGLEGRYKGAALWAGLALNCNVFMGLWAGAAMYIAQLGQSLASGRRISPRDLFAPGLVYVAVGLPVIAWVLHILSATVHGTSGEDYLNFLWNFYPYHYFIQASDSTAIGSFVMSVMTGAMAILYLTQRRDEVALLFTTNLTFFIVGVVAPLFVTSKIIFDLQFMRCDTFITILAFCLVFAAARCSFDSARIDDTDSKIMMGVAAICILLGVWVLVAICFVHNLQIKGRAAPLWLRVGFLLAIAAIVATLGLETPELLSPRLQRLLVSCYLIALVLVRKNELVALFPLTLAFDYAGLHHLEAFMVLLTLPWLTPRDVGAGHFRRAAIVTAMIIAIVVMLALSPGGWGGTAALPLLSEFVAGFARLPEGRPDHLLQLLALAVLTLVLGLLISRDHLALRRLRAVETRLRPAALLSVAAIFLILPTAISAGLYRTERGTLSNLTVEQRALRDYERALAARLPPQAFVFLALRDDTFSVFAKRNYWWGLKYADGVVCNPALGAAYLYRRRVQQRYQYARLDRHADEFAGLAAAHAITHILVDNRHLPASPVFEVAHRGAQFSLLQLTRTQ